MSPKDDSKLSNSNLNQIPRDGISFQVALLPDPSGQHPWMSGVTMLVRWLFPASALLDLVSVNTRSCPASRKCTPRQRYVNQQAASCSKHVNQQAASWSKVGSSRSVPMVLLSLDFGQAIHSTYLDKARVRAVGPSGSHRATIREFRDTVGKTCRTTQKAKTKASDPTRGE